MSKKRRTDITVYRQESFINCRLRLDGHAYHDCTFENVIIEYGGGEFIFEKNKVGIYVLSLVGEFAQSLASLRKFAEDIGGGAADGIAGQIKAMIQPPISFVGSSLN